MDNIRQSILDELKSKLKTKADSKIRHTTDCLYLTLECIDGCNFEHEGYLVGIFENDKLSMSIMVFRNSKYPELQYHFGITKYSQASDKLKNISMVLHSYCSKLFNTKYIVSRPLKKMIEIFARYSPIIVQDDIEESKFFNIPPKELESIIDIECGVETYIIPVSSLDGIDIPNLDFRVFPLTKDTSTNSDLLIDDALRHLFFSLLRRVSFHSSLRSGFHSFIIDDALRHLLFSHFTSGSESRRYTQRTP